MIDILDPKFIPPEAERPQLPEYSPPEHTNLTIAHQLAEVDGDWLSAYSHYRSIRELGDRDIIRRETAKEAVLKEAQMLINLGELGPADNLVHTNQERIIDRWKTPEAQSKVRAEFLVKRGWLADLRNQFPLAQDLFSQVLAGVDPERSRSGYGAYWTAMHFLGRANLGQALRMTDKNQKDHLIASAERCFNTDLRRLRALRDTGDKDKYYPLNIAFEYSWLTECALACGNLFEAQSRLNLAEANYIAARNQSKQQHLMAGAWQLKARIELARAYQGAGLADRVVEPIADGLASSFWLFHGKKNRVSAAESAWLLSRVLSQADLTEASVAWANYSLTTYPYIIDRPFVNL